MDTKLDTKVAYTSRLIFFLASRRETRDCWKKIVSGRTMILIDGEGWIVRLLEQVVVVARLVSIIQFEVCAGIVRILSWILLFEIIEK